MIKLKEWLLIGDQFSIGEGDQFTIGGNNTSNGDLMTASKLHEAIQDIAAKHGVILSKDDPILILQTMNDRLLEENRQAQQDMLRQFKEEMENISSQWKHDANEKAEKILNAALESSKEAMSRLLQESTHESIQAMKRMISESLTEAHNLTLQTRKFSRFTLLSLVIILTVSCLFMLVFFCSFFAMKG